MVVIYTGTAIVGVLTMDNDSEHITEFLEQREADVRNLGLTGTVADVREWGNSGKNLRLRRAG